MGRFPVQGNSSPPAPLRGEADGKGGGGQGEGGRGGGGCGGPEDNLKRKPLAKRAEGGHPGLAPKRALPATVGVTGDPR